MSKLSASMKVQIQLENSKNKWVNKAIRSKKCFQMSLIKKITSIHKPSNYIKTQLAEFL